MSNKKEYPYNLLDAMTKWSYIGFENFKYPNQLPEDFHQSLAYVLASLKDRESKAILAYYRDNRTLKSIGVEFGIGQERVRQIINRGVCKLGHPSRRRFLEIGIQAMITSYGSALSGKETLDDIKTLGICILGLDSNTHLYLAGIYKVSDIVSMTKSKLVEIHGIGKKRADDIINKVHKMGLLFKDEIN